MNFLRGAIFFLTAMLIQWWWATHFSLAGLAPQLLLILTVVVAARQGPVRAMCLGFGWGLFLDVLNPALFGANALALTLAGYGTGALRRLVDVTGLAPQCVVVFGMTWAYFLALGMIGVVFAKYFVWVGWPAFLFDPFYNCLTAGVLFLFWTDRRVARRLL
ncbi:MAG: rod shape-determining protein MreD [Elusimicrobia bacterium RIFCSPHIGHO2_02_FULL_57_9]|nr:MAG: rod shape-determining protein MreD [Elusimicrobia bacterium RIFCSPHIGHO2_02_FULL_57_9]